MQNIKILIREEQSSDAEALAQIYVESAKHHYRLNPKKYKIPSKKDVVSNSVSKKHGIDSIAFVAEYDGVPVGSIGVQLRKLSPITMSRSKVVAEINISVKEELRG